jgi:hypothetical protein
MERIADIVEAGTTRSSAGPRHPDLDRHLDRRGVPGGRGALNLVMLPFYIAGAVRRRPGRGAVLRINGWLTGRMYYELVALRRLSPAEVKAGARQLRRAVADRHRHRLLGHHPDPEPDRAGAGRRPPWCMWHKRSNRPPARPAL